MGRSIGSGAAALAGGVLCTLFAYAVSDRWRSELGYWPMIVGAGVGLLGGAVVGAANEIVQAINAQGERIAKAIEQQRSSVQPDTTSMKHGTSAPDARVTSTRSTSSN
ncbi:MAG TPA: hypothetical protein VH643_13995 [Gemmataceae bacterium]|jgi:hypothetical protein